MIRQFKTSDVRECSKLYAAAYNSKKWGCHWQADSAERYLKELSSQPRFVGFVVNEEEQLRGALFCHERTSWNADEIYVDDLFIGPQYQQLGYGHELLQALNDHIQRKHLSGATLMTCKKMPAWHFYEENGYKEAEGIRLMYKAAEQK